MSIVGSKNASGVAEQIISLLPVHRLFIEAFAGGAAITLKKKPSELTILCERDQATAEQLLATIRDRQLTSTTVIHGDAISELPASMLDREDTCLYCDPPYMMATRKNRRRYYRCDWDDIDHSLFLGWVSALKCRVVISGYWSELYATVLQGWRSVSFGAPTRRGRAIEWAWCNFGAEVPLHDVRFVGVSYTDRQRIKRKASRWVRMLASMQPAERSVILEAIRDYAGSAIDDSDYRRRQPQPSTTRVDRA